MKKLILLLLLIPILSFGQTYKDIMSINSVDMYKKVSIENGYTFVKEQEDGWIWYGYDVTKDSSKISSYNSGGHKATRWAYYNNKDNRFSFIFSMEFSILSNITFNSIIEEIKENCKYYGIVPYNYERGDWTDDDYVCYSCSESTYLGKIGFVVTEDENTQLEVGIIRHFPD